MKPMSRNYVIRTSTLGAVAVSALLLAGCSTLRGLWPFGHGQKATAQPVTELLVELPEGGPVPVVLQYWERDTLVLDLTNVAGTGRVTLRRQAEHSWPARLALRMAPRRFEMAEVRGATRVALPVSAAAGPPVTVELPPELYAADTPQLRLSWGAAASF
jgi:uncharacterized protein (UPF0548 family)